MSSRPTAAPTAHTITVSVSWPRTIDARDAPSEARSANSPRRSRTRHNVKFVTFVQPMSSSDVTAAPSTNSAARCDPYSESRRSVRLIVKLPCDWG